MCFWLSPCPCISLPITAHPSPSAQQEQHRTTQPETVYTPISRLGLDLKAEPMTVIQEAYQESGRVVAQQEVCRAKVAACMDQMASLVQQAQRAAMGGSDPKALMVQLRSSLESQLKEANSSTRALHSAIGKLTKLADKLTDEKADITKVMRKNVHIDKQALITVLAKHLFREGRFESGHALLQEAGMQGDAKGLAAPFQAMHEVLVQIRARNTEPALQWAHAQMLLLSMQENGRGREEAKVAVQAFQFRLHTLDFLMQLLHKGQQAALCYAHAHLAPFHATHMRAIQRLMGCLIFCKSVHKLHGPHAEVSQPMATEGQAPGSAAEPEMTVEGAAGAVGSDGDVAMGEAESAAGGSTHDLGPPLFTLAGSPYAQMASESAWNECALDFLRLACSLMGLAFNSPVAVVLAAGAAALPGLIKMASVLERTGALTSATDLRTCEQLPMELELGSEFVFHPIFACPVSREQSSPDNPPLLLPCNHVLCEQSVLKIAKSRTRVFKCPYCPVEARADNLRPLVFPPVSSSLGLFT